VPDCKPILLFCCRFLLVYGLLIAPWPGWDAAYGRFFREVGNLIFSRTNPRHFVIFETGDATIDAARRTEVLAGDRNLLDAHDYGPMKQMDLDTRLMSFVPASLIIALILATPLPWRRRVWALLWGLICLYGFDFLQIAIWLLQEPANSPGGLAILDLPSFARVTVNHLLDILLDKMDMVGFVPIVIWILATFRQRDLAKLLKNDTTKTISSGSPVGGQT
jgi:hypothetical protein